MLLKRKQEREMRVRERGVLRCGQKRKWTDEDASWRKDGRNRLRACGAGSVGVGK